jgi:hypothetical protein
VAGVSASAGDSGASKVIVRANMILVMAGIFRRPFGLAS